MADVLVEIVVSIGRWFAYEAVYAVLALIIPDKRRAVARRMSVDVALSAALALCFVYSALAL